MWFRGYCYHRKQPKPKKRLVVHLGLRKVATTSIQAWLQENAHVLQREYGVLVLARSSHFYLWREIVYAFMNGKLSQRKFLGQIEKEARTLKRWMQKQPETTILVSDENLFGARLYKQEENGSITTLYDWAVAVLPRVESIWKDSFDLTFVLYVRKEEPAWLQSCYNQEVKNNRLELTQDEWAAKLLPTTKGWNPQFRQLQQHLQSPFRIVLLGEEPQLGSTLLQEIGVEPIIFPCQHSTISMKVCPKPPWHS